MISLASLQYASLCDEEEIRAVNRDISKTVWNSKLWTRVGEYTVRESVSYWLECHQRYWKPGDADPAEKGRKWSVMRKEEESRSGP